VKGKKVYGKWPGLEPGQLYEGRDLALTTDFRSVFSEIATKHLGATNLSAMFPGFNSPQRLGLRWGSDRRWRIEDRPRKKSEVNGELPSSILHHGYY